MPLALRLYLPPVWTDDAERPRKARVPDAFCAARSKGEIALAEIDRVMAAGVRFSAVLADAGYGISTAFRQALSARGLAWAVGIPRIQKVFPADVTMAAPPPARRPSRQSLVPAVEACAAETALVGKRWRTLTWRQGTKGALKAAFRGPARARGEWSDGAPAWAQRPAHARCRGLAGRRAPRFGRALVLPIQSAGPHHPEAAGRDDQGALSVRAGAPAA